MLPRPNRLHPERQIDKIKLEDIKPLQSVSPFIRFNQEKKLHRQALILENLKHGFDGETLFKEAT